MDISNFRDVESIHRTPGQRQNYDLAYSGKTEKFRAPSHVWSELRMERNGFRMLRGEDDNGNEQIILALVPEDNAVMWSRRYSQEDDKPLNKTKESTNRPMQETLAETFPDNVQEDGSANYRLTPVGEEEVPDGEGGTVEAQLFHVEPYDERGSGIVDLEDVADEDVEVEETSGSEEDADVEVEDASEEVQEDTSVEEDADEAEGTSEQSEEDDSSDEEDEDPFTL